MGGARVERTGCARHSSWPFCSPCSIQTHRPRLRTIRWQPAGPPWRPGGGYLKHRTSAFTTNQLPLRVGCCPFASKPSCIRRLSANTGYWRYFLIADVQSYDYAINLDGYLLRLYLIAMVCWLNYPKSRNVEDFRRYDSSQLGSGRQVRAQNCALNQTWIFRTSCTSG